LTWNLLTQPANFWMLQTNMDLFRWVSPLRIALSYTLLGVVWVLLAASLFSQQFPEIGENFSIVFGFPFLVFTGYLGYRILLSWQRALAARSESQRINKLYTLLYQCNQASIRSRNQEELFFQVCHLAVEYGGMAMAWIGLLENESKRVKPSAWYSQHKNNPESIAIDTSSDGYFSNSYTRQAIIKDCPVWCQDINNDPDVNRRQIHTKNPGWNSFAVLPLHCGGKVFGLLSVYSKEIDAFDETARKLLVEMVANIDFALHHFANEAARERTDRELLASQRYLQAIIDNGPDCVKTLNAVGQVLAMNKAGLAMIEAESLEQVNGCGLHRFIAPDCLEAFYAMHQRVLEGEKGFLEFVSIGLKGTRRWLETTATLLPGWPGDGPVVLSITRDVTERKEAESQLRLAAQVFEQSSEGFVITDANKKIIMANKAFTRVTGYSLEEVKGKDPGQFLASGLQDDAFYLSMWDSINNQGFWQGEIWNKRKDGAIYPELLNISQVADSKNRVTHYVGIFTDLSQLKASEKKLEFLAHHDPLTHLPNRALLHYRIQLAISRCQREHKLLALMMLDLDRFKNINDSFGHLAGDDLLQQVAKRLSASLRKIDTVARLGGDEFTILLEDVKDFESAAKVAQTLIHQISEPFCLNRFGDVKIGASIGISFFPNYGKTPEILMQQADSALYLAKSQGRGRYAYFSNDLTIAAQKRMALDNKLRKAIAIGELSVFYQPQVDIASGRIVGAEALLRWLSPQEGVIMPDSFIPLAEENGLILQIGEFVLREVCRQGRKWLDEGLPNIRLAVNVSPHQFAQSDLESSVISILQETGFPAQQLELELTETALMARQEENIKLLNKLRSMGMRFAIDDFGTGYSSLAYLKRFPLDLLKIDKSFIEDIPEHADDMEIASSIIAIGETLGFKVLAEGVENDLQLGFLASKGCDLYQGYLFSGPLPAEEFAKLLRGQGAPVKTGFPVQGRVH